jgi:hypothetical protein
MQSAEKSKKMMRYSTVMPYPTIIPRRVLLNVIDTDKRQRLNRRDGGLVGLWGGGLCACGVRTRMRE